MRRWFKLRARIRYWSRRALKAERQLSELRDHLAIEVDRNRMREDTFVSASIMGQRGMYGVAPRQAPPLKRVAAVPVDEWSTLRYADKQEFEMVWRPEAERAGVSLPQARADFLRELEKRPTLTDDGFN